MLSPTSFALPVDCEPVAAGGVVGTRRAPLDCVTYLESGRAAFGVCEDGQMRHQLGVAEGPLWLDTAAAILGLPAFVDTVAETPVVLRRLPLAEFRRDFTALPAPVRVLMHDMARCQHQQTELAVSRLAQDAEARCAQWLLHHAERGEGAWRVTLRQRKRLIAAQLGIAPETFSRVLRHLRERGLVAGAGSVLDLPSPAALQTVARR